MTYGLIFWGNLPVVLPGWEICSLALRKPYRLKSFENRVQRRIFGPEGGDVTGDGEGCIIMSFINCNLHQL
jgi:hypothetical protein